MILGVLVVMAGKTVQVCQVVGWLPVHPIGDLRLPYWAGLWFGVFPTWEGIAAQLGAVLFVVGSYFGAEWVRARNRRAKVGQVRPAPAPQLQTAREAALTLERDLERDLEHGPLASCPAARRVPAAQPPCLRRRAAARS